MREFLGHKWLLRFQSSHYDIGVGWVSRPRTLPWRYRVWHAYRPVGYAAFIGKHLGFFWVGPNHA